MSDVRFVPLEETAQVAPWAEGLRRLEAGIEYPLADGADAFVIDHGHEYHPFFSDMGNARFLLAVGARNQVVGSIAAVQRELTWRGRTRSALYLCDLKVAPSMRGRGLARRLLWNGLTHLIRIPALRKTRFIYGAAMRGARGDVMRSARGAHPFRVAGQLAELHVYFADPRTLAGLDLQGCPPAPSEAEGLALGPTPGVASKPLGLCSTAGRKDLRRRSTGTAWPLVHLALGPGGWKPHLGAYLKACGEALLRQESTVEACFALDTRLGDQASWLASRGVTPGATCTVYALSLPPLSPPPAWVHLPTSEI